MVHQIRDTTKTAKQVVHEWAETAFDSPNHVTHLKPIMGTDSIYGWTFRLAEQGTRVYTIRMNEDGWLIQE